MEGGLTMNPTSLPPCSWTPGLQDHEKEISVIYKLPFSLQNYKIA